MRRDVGWLLAWKLPSETYYGCGIGPLRPFACACAVPLEALPTAAQVVADLHKPGLQATAPGVQLDTVSPPWRRPSGGETGVNQIHKDVA